MIWNLREHDCPLCGCELLTRSRRRGFFEKVILPFTNIRPYRCARCGVRHYSRMPRSTAPKAHKTSELRPSPPTHA